ncbi:MAG: DUF4249 family protein, partial [Bacteroidota bacterium]
WQSLSENESGEFNWTTDLPEPGDVLEVRALAPGFEEIRAKTSVPLAVNLETDQWSDRTFLNSDGVLMSVLPLGLADPEADVENYFMLLSFVERLAEGERSALGLNTNNPVVEFRAFYSEKDQFRLFNRITYRPHFWTDEFFANDRLSLDLHMPKESLERAREIKQDRWGINLLSIDRNTYQFLKTADLAKQNDDNLFAEPQPIYSNIEGGAGVFGAMVRSEYLADW